MKALKALNKVPVMSFSPPDLVAQHIAESDRSALILAGSLLDDLLREALTLRFTGLNSEELASLFDYNGPLGQFSARIKLAQALGLISRDVRNRLEVVRELRNVAAHAQGSISFGTVEVRDAILAIFDVARTPKLAGVDSEGLRKLHSMVIAVLNAQICGSKEAEAWPLEGIANACVAEFEARTLESKR